MPYRQRNNVFYPASAITLQKQRAKRRQAKARDPVGDDCRVVKVATNRKNPWQRNL